MTPRRRARLLLFATVLVWGGSFSIVKAALRECSPLLFNLLRMLLATAVLAVVNRRALRTVSRQQLRAGALAGAFLAAGYQFQTLGLAHTTAAKSAFLTGLVVVLVPLLTLVPALRPAGTRRPGLATAAGAAVAFAGLLLLTTAPGTAPRDLLAAVGTGDLLTMLCAVAFAGHLLTLARVSPGMSSGLLATLQVGFAALAMLLTLPLEPAARVRFSPGLLLALAATSVFSTAAAFTVQSYSQRYLPPAETAVILTLEPVFAGVVAAVGLAERFTPRAIGGAALILVSIALVELVPGLARSRELPA